MSKVRLWFFALGFCVFLFASPASASECRAAKPKITIKKVGACVIRTQKGRFIKGDWEVEFNSGTLRCGKKTLLDGSKVVTDARALCLHYDPKTEVGLPFELSQEIRSLGLYRRLISVEITNGGFTGGVHPFALIRRATFDTRTGKRTTIRALFGEKASEKILADAKKAFEKKDMSDYYRFDPDSFSLRPAGTGRVKITFVAPYAVELYRGTTLDVTVGAPAPK